MHTTIETITPAVAAAYLEFNRNNRPIKAKHVAQLAASMARGQWMLTHESIAFASSGRLIDGQHRLSAIVKSGITVRMAVTRDSDQNTFAVIGDAARRTGCDVLSTLSEANASRLAGMIRCALEGMDRGAMVSKADIREFIASPHSGVARELIGACVGKGEHLPAPCMGACLRGILSGELQKGDAVAALKRYKEEDWSEHKRKDPMRAMRQMLKREQVTTERYAYAVRAWRAVARNEPLEKLYKADNDFSFTFNNA